MVTTQRRYVKSEQVQEDFHMQSPRINFGEQPSRHDLPALAEEEKLRAISEQRKSLIFSEIQSQGGAISNLIGKVEVELNHRVPMAEKWMDSVSDFLSLDSKSFSLINLARHYYCEWYLGALLFLFFGYLVGGHTNRVARFGFFICIGLGNILSFIYCMAYIEEGHETFLAMIAEMKKVYEHYAGSSEEEESGKDSDQDVEVIAQSGISVDIMSSLLMSILSFGLGYKPKSSGILAIKEFLRTTPVMKDNMMGIVSTSYSMLNELSTKLKCEKYLSTILEIPVVDDTVEKWNFKVNAFINSINNNTDGSYEENMTLYSMFIKESKEIEKTLTKGSISYITLVDTVKSLEKCKNNANKRFTALKGFRPEPVLTFFRGAPGVAKSVLSSRFATMLNNVTLPEHLLSDFIQRPDNYVFRKSTDKWWDGYTEKANVTIIDDIFQIVEGLVDPTTADSAMVIRMTNAEEFAVPIAEAAGKNSTYFRSNFIIASSNTFSPNLLAAVHCKNAVRRRLHFFVDVTVSEKYIKDEKTNWEMLPHIVDGEGNIIPDATTFPEDFWQLRYSEMQGTNETETVDITFTELFEKVVERHFKHLMQFEINKTAAQEEMLNMRDSSIRRINSAKEKYSTLRESLRNKFIPNVKTSKINMPGIYPQGGLPIYEDTSDSEQSDIPEIKCSIQETLVDHYLDLDNTHRAFLTHVFHRTLYLYDANAIWGKQPLIAFLKSLDDYDSHHYLKIFEEDTIGVDGMGDKFGMQLNLTFNSRIKNNCTPHLGDKLPFTSRLKNVGNSFTDTLSKCLVFINRYRIPIVIGAVASASVIYTIHKLIRTLSGKATAQSGNTDRYIGRGPSRGNTSKASQKERKRDIKIPLSQAGVEFKTLLNGSSFKLDYKSAQRDIFTAVIDKYHFIMYVHETIGGELRSKRLGHCINIVGNIYAMPYHFLLNLEDFISDTKDKEPYVTITTASNARKFSVSVKNLLKSSTFTEESINTDLCIFRAGHEELAKGALKFFVTDNQDNWRKRSTFPVTIIGTSQSGDSKEHTSFRIVESKTSFIKDGIIIKPTWKAEYSHRYRLLNTLRYEGDFAAGDCGSLIFLKQNDLGCSVIAGFHLAGETSLGYGNIITQSMLQELLDLEDPIITFEDEIEPQGLSRNNTLKLDYHIPELLCRGTFDSRSSVATCSKSDIVKSQIYGKIPGDIGRVRERPALLFSKIINGKEINPKNIALQNYARFPPHIDNAVLNEAIQSYYNVINRYDDVLTSYKIVIDTKQALHSFGDHVHSIASSTSAGWPMNTNLEDDLKKMYYKSLLQNDLELNSLAFSQIDIKIKEIEDMYRNNIRPVFIYSDALKDETRPIEKVLEGKTRMFSGCPFTLLIMFRKYFGSFIDYYFDKNLDLGSAIGINPYSSDWHDLAMNLTRFSSHGTDLCVGAGDFSKFDCSETPEILQGIYQIISTWYGSTGEDNIIRFMLWKEITHSRHVFGNEYYEWSNGMPSGNPMTAIINTMYNHLAFRMSFHYAGCDIEDFNKNVYLCALGDDNVFCVSDEYKEKFNELTLVSCMERIGLKYTTELKGEATVPFRALEQVEFLKRSFRPVRLKGVIRYLAPIQFATIVNMLYWTKKGHMKDQISCDNISLALREISLHGQYVFEEYYPLLRSLKEQYYPDIVSKHSSYTDYKSTLYAVLDMEHRL